MLDFYVGQKVVCVDAAPRKAWSDLNGLAEGETYTIRWLGIAPSAQAKFHGAEGIPAVRLNEIVRSTWCGDGCESAYDATRFRPLINTDISVFQAMLAPKPVKQRESENA